MEIINAHITSANRPRTSLRPTSVTIHNTGNVGATARNNRDYFQNHPAAQVSYHWVVDDLAAVHCIPENEVAWHAGAAANRQSIGVGVCEFTEAPRQQKANEHAALLVALILQRYGWGVDKVTTHRAWTRKNCPAKLLPMWDAFLGMIARRLSPRLMLDGREVDIELLLQAGRTYAPVRSLLEHLGYRVSWDEATKTVHGRK